MYIMFIPRDGNVVICIIIDIYIYRRKAKRMVLQCINGVGSNPVEGRTSVVF